MRRVTKICIVILVIFSIFAASVLFGINSRTTRDISYYQALSGEIEGKSALWIFPWGDYVECPYELPKLCEMGDYQDYRFVHNAKRVSITSHHAYVLIVEYKEREYEAQKQAIQNRYTYCTEKSQGFTDGHMTECMYSMDEFLIRAVEGGRYPSEMLFVGTSDTRKEIAIIYYYDQDLDNIDDPLGKFIDNNTGWNEIV